MGNDVLYGYKVRFFRNVVHSHRTHGRSNSTVVIVVDRHHGKYGTKCASYLYSIIAHCSNWPTCLNLSTGRRMAKAK